MAANRPSLARPLNDPELTRSAEAELALRRQATYEREHRAAARALELLRARRYRQRYKAKADLALGLADGDSDQA